MFRGSVWTAALALVFGLGLATTATAQQPGNGYPDAYDYGYDQNDSGYGSQAYRPFDYSNERQYREPHPNPYDRNANEYREPAQPQYVDPYDAGADPSQPPSDQDLGQTINRRTMVEVPNTTNQPPGTIVIDTASRHLYYTQPGGQALRYGIGVGRQGFTWKGDAKVQRKAQWPDWIPPSDMLKRRPDLPLRMSGGIENPLGARALYLFQGNRDTMFRIHGTNEPDSIGKAVSSGCIRMMNGDVIDLYSRVPVGTKVVVL